MRKLIFVILLFPLLISAQTDAYFRDIDWKFYPDSVIQLTDSTFKMQAVPFDFNDPGAISRTIGNFVVDFVGHRYRVIDSTSTTITVLDAFHTGQAPQSGQIARCYRSVGGGEADYVGSVDYSPLDESARWKLNGADNELLWRHGIEYESPFKRVVFDTNYSIFGNEVKGTKYWDVANGVVSTVLGNGVIYQEGEELFIDGQNDTGGTILNGTPVEYAGSIGNSGNFRIRGALVQPDKPVFHFVGIATETIVNGAVGKLTLNGKVRGIQTNGANYGETWVPGDVVYPSHINRGWLTKVMPPAPYPAIPVAMVISAHANNGTLEVHPVYPQRFQDAPDVNGGPLTADGQIPSWNNTQKYFDFSKNINSYLPLAGGTMANTNLVTNMNADLLDGLHGSSYQSFITAGTTLQYWRGDKSFQTLNTAAVPELTNLYYTDSRSRAAISLTTTGTSGAATYSSSTGVLNVPHYTLAGLGFDAANFIQNQNASAQTANMWVSGTGRFGGNVTIPNATLSTHAMALGQFNTAVSGTTNYISKFTGSNSLRNSQIFDNGTNVGIGTTAPETKLQIGTEFSAQAGTNKTVNLGTVSSYSTATALQYSVNGYYATTVDATDIFAQTGGETSKNFFTGIVSDGGYFNSNRFSIIGNGAERLSILQNGNVGIGTTTPTHVLQANTTNETVGNYFPLNLRHTATNANASPRGIGLSFSDAYTTTGTGQINATIVAKRLNSSGNYRSSLSFNINSASGVVGTESNLTEAMTIDYTGNVGIGTTAPSEKLEVNGKTKTATLQMTTGAINGYYLKSDATGNGTWAEAVIEVPLTFTGGLTRTVNSIAHTNSITAGNFGDTGATRTLAFGGTFTVPYVTYDANGHLSTRSNLVLTMPANPNITQTLSKDSTAITNGKVYGISLLNANRITVTDMNTLTALSEGTRTATTYGITSDGGANDIALPLATGTFAGLSLNDYTTTEKNKLSGIATGAEVNVNADWNAISGDAQIMNNPFLFNTVSNNQLIKYNSISQRWENWTPNFITGFTETDPIFSAWNKSTGINITASQVSDFQTNVTNNTNVTANTAARHSHTNKQVLDGITSADTLNWLAAFNDKINSLAFSGTTTKTLTLTQQDGGTVSNTFTDNDAQNLSLGTVTSTTQPVNISGGTGVTLPAATTTTAGLFTGADKTKLDGIAAGAGIGTVTSVGMTVPTGFSIAGSPVTASGTLGLSFAFGYRLPLIAEIDNGNIAYNDKINSLAFSGTTTKTLTLTQQDGTTLTGSFTDETGGGGGAPTGVNYLVGTADGTLTNEIAVGITPGGILGNTWANPTLDNYSVTQAMLASYTQSPPAQGTFLQIGGMGMDWGNLPTANTGGALGIATFTAADFNSSSGTISIDYTNGQSASVGNKGFLTAADWGTFNGKVGGSGTSGQVAYWSGATALTTDADFTFDGLNLRVGSTNGTGNVSSGNFTLSSDIRLKENIKRLENLDWVDKINFYNFNYKKDLTKTKRFGVIAQEVEKVQPDLVKIQDGVKTVSYIDLLITKVARQDEVIEQLLKRIEKLENEK